MEDETASHDVVARIRASFDSQGLPAVGDHLEAVGTVLKSGRTLTVCRLDVYGVQGTQRSLVATGQQTLICVNERPEVAVPSSTGSLSG